MILSPVLLEALTEHWKRYQPKEWLFPGREMAPRMQYPITPKVVWYACREAAKRSGLEKKVHPHVLRHCICNSSA